MNEVTPRVFVAGTQQNDGKTTFCIGLFAALKKRFARIGFIKPVGQRFVEVDGHHIDEDSVLIDATYHVRTPIEAMSPIAVEPDFTRRYIENANNEQLVRRIQHSFDRAAWEKDFTIIEGTGHAGVGSVFDLSNARVASLLNSKAIIVTGGGIGRPIDEVALNRAVFDKHGVELAGVIVNKAHPEKIPMLKEMVSRGLNRMGLELLGVIPAEPMLAHPTLQQICDPIQGEFIHGESKGRRRVDRVMIAAMTPGHVMQHIDNRTLIITSGDREDVIMAALATNSLATRPADEVIGIVLAGGLMPHPRVLELIRRSQVPTILSPSDSYNIARKINGMTIKTLPGDTEKIQKIEKLFEEHVNLNRLLEKVGR